MCSSVGSLARRYWAAIPLGIAVFAFFRVLEWLFEPIPLVEPPEAGLPLFYGPLVAELLIVAGVGFAFGLVLCIRELVFERMLRWSFRSLIRSLVAVVEALRRRA